MILYEACLSTQSCHLASKRSTKQSSTAVNEIDIKVDNMTKIMEYNLVLAHNANHRPQLKLHEATTPKPVPATRFPLRLGFVLDGLLLFAPTNRPFLSETVEQEDS